MRQNANARQLANMALFLGPAIVLLFMFFIAPVVWVKMWVFTVGRWRMFSPMKRFGMWKPLG